MREIIIIGIVIVLFLAWHYIGQRYFIYFPDRSRPDLAQSLVKDMQVVSMTTADGLTLNAWYKPAAPSAPTILYLHGNAGHIGYRAPIIRPFLNAGLGVLLLSYRGYGANPGKPTEQGLYLDAAAAYHFLRKQGVRPKCIVLLGESIGSAVAIFVASKYPVNSVILQAPFTSLVALGKVHYPFLPVNWLLWDRFESIRNIKKINAPLLILAGNRDYIVPVQLSQQLFNAANSPKQMQIFPDKGHNDFFHQAWFDAVLGFIKQYLHCGLIMKPASNPLCQTCPPNNQ